MEEKSSQRALRGLFIPCKILPWPGTSERFCVGRRARFAIKARQKYRANAKTVLSWKWSPERWQSGWMRRFA